MSICNQCYDERRKVSTRSGAVYRVVDSGNRKTFLEFIKHNVVREFPNHKYLLMDNARIHHCKEIKEFIISKGKVPVYTIPYTPELNPIRRAAARRMRFLF